MYRALSLLVLPLLASSPVFAQASHSLSQIQTSDIGVSWGERFISLLGLGLFVLLGYALSTNRKAIRWNTIGYGLVLQFVFAIIVLKTGVGRSFFSTLNDLVGALLGFSTEGAKFVFGNLVYPNVPVGVPAGPAPAFGYVAGGESWANTGALFAFGVLPTILFVSSLMAVLYHLGIMQRVVQVMAWVMARSMKTSGAESLSAAANIFVGQTEAPLLVRPFVGDMTRSELHAVMVGGMATVAGGVMAAYVGMLQSSFPDIAGHLLAASVLSAPAALVMAKLMVPEEETPRTAGQVKVVVERIDANVIDAASRGAAEGLTLALNVAAMLIAFIALVAMINSILSHVGAGVGLDGLSLQVILGYIFWPVAWVMGIPAADCTFIGQLLGERFILNEFISYLHLSQALNEGQDISPRAVVLSTYAMCGFANIGSIGIQLGGIGGIAPQRRGDLARLGLRALIAGTVASFMTACVAGILL